MDQNGAKRYSLAIFEVAKQKDKIDLFSSELSMLSNVFNENIELLQVLNHPNIQLKDKKDLIDKVFKGNVDDEIMGLIYVLLEHGKISEINRVVKHYDEIVREYRGIKIAYVTTAVEMDEKEKDILKDKLSKQYGCIIEIENIVDKNIIGGVYLKVGDEVIDGTVKGNFENMKKQLLRK